MDPLIFFHVFAGFVSLIVKNSRLEKDVDLLALTFLFFRGELAESTR